MKSSFSPPAASPCCPPDFVHNPLAIGGNCTDRGSGGAPALCVGKPREIDDDHDDVVAGELDDEKD